jgi:hypothetical protein
MHYEQYLIFKKIIKNHMFSDDCFQGHLHEKSLLTTCTWGCLRHQIWTAYLCKFFQIILVCDFFSWTYILWWAGRKRSLFAVEAWRRKKKCAKNSGATASVALLRNNFTPARARCGPYFTSSGRRIDASQIFKWQS